VKKIGLTGGIGSGKSTVARILLAMGYPVYFSDDRSKQLTQTHPDIRKGLTELIGTQIYRDNRLDRSALALAIFSDGALREKVNQIIHPVVRADFDRWVEEQTHPIVFNEAAILFETGAAERFDAMVLVTAPLELRIQRVMKRDLCSHEEVVSRINHQWTDAQKMLLADAVIVNDEVQPLIKQVEHMLIRLA
jgi:dephospho-CoA kinase